MIDAEAPAPGFWGWVAMRVCGAPSRESALEGLGKILELGGGPIPLGDKPEMVDGAWSFLGSKWRVQLHRGEYAIFVDGLRIPVHDLAQSERWEAMLGAMK